MEIHDERRRGIAFVRGRHMQNIAAIEYGAVTRCGAPFQVLPLALSSSYRGPSTPMSPKRHWFGLFPFRSPLLGKSMFLSFPADTEMFQFSACAHRRRCMMSSTSWVVPFGSLRIISCLQIPADFRSLPCPSSHGFVI